jgi:hypothetical protein
MTLNARVREQARACGVPSSEASPVRGRNGPSSEAEPARGKRTPLERGGARTREARILERGEACSRGSSSGPPRWAVGVSAMWAVSCMVKRGVFGFGSVAGFKWGFPSCLRGPLGLSPTPQNMQLQRSFQPQRFNPQTPRAPTPQLSHPNNGSGALVRNTNPVQPNGCFKCGELGHYANNYPKRVMQTPQRDSGNRTGQQSSQAHTPQTPSKRGQQNHVRGRVNHVSVEQAQNDSGVVLGTFVTTPPEIIAYYRLNHSIWSLSDNKEASR